MNPTGIFHKPHPNLQRRDKPVHRHPSNSHNPQANVTAQPALTLALMEPNWSFLQAAPESSMLGQSTSPSNAHDCPTNTMAQPTRLSLLLNLHPNCLRRDKPTLLVHGLTLFLNKPQPSYPPGPTFHHKQLQWKIPLFPLCMDGQSENLCRPCENSVVMQLAKRT
ncbi:hypothetical protein JVT61DRAFT_12199 [Boletus reticuloceps]|uniref:Uncharacterized protein n=1 Tax=Boletus reticuloceps TaxID=495285 RepID=A0A8I2YEB3_9AGAM|nr:hypothetical protein JVT61DRAFT_12199 [Boletus reticuloceps]